MLEDIYNLRLACWMFKRPHCTYRVGHDRDMRYPNRLRSDFHRLTKGQQSVGFQGPKLWNEIPLNLKSSISLIAFKNKYKNYILSKY